MGSTPLGLEVQFSETGTVVCPRQSGFGRVCDPLAGTPRLHPGEEVAVACPRSCPAPPGLCELCPPLSSYGARPSPGGWGPLVGAEANTLLTPRTAARVPGGAAGSGGLSETWAESGRSRQEGSSGARACQRWGRTFHTEAGLLVSNRRSLCPKRLFLITNGAGHLWFPLREVTGPASPSGAVLSLLLGLLPARTFRSWCARPSAPSSSPHSFYGALERRGIP